MSAPEASAIAPGDPVEDLWGTWRGHVSTRALNLIRREGIETVGGLTGRTAGELREIRNLGDGSLAEVRRVLAANGLHLAGEGTAKRPPDPDEDVFELAAVLARHPSATFPELARAVLADGRFGRTDGNRD